MGAGRLSARPSAQNHHSIRRIPMQRPGLTPFTLARTSILGAVVCAALLIGCKAASEPVNATTFLWGYVVDASGVCIPGATVRVVLGQRAGETTTQTTPCSAWDYGNGFSFTDLTVGVEMTLQASAPGYAVQEKTLVASLGPQVAIIFTPS